MLVNTQRENIILEVWVPICLRGSIHFLNEDFNILVMIVLTGQQSVSSMKAGMSPTSSTEQNSDRQFGIICSEKHARVSVPDGDLVNCIFLGTIQKHLVNVLVQN